MTTYATKRELLAANWNTPDSWVTSDVVKGYEEAANKLAYTEKLASELMDESSWFHWPSEENYEASILEMGFVSGKIKEMIEDFLGAVEQAVGQAASELAAENAWLQDAEYDPEHWAVGGDAYRN